MKKYLILLLVIMLTSCTTNYYIVVKKEAVSVNDYSPPTYNYFKIVADSATTKTNIYFAKKINELKNFNFINK